MKRSLVFAIVSLFLMPRFVSALQIVAGSTEDKVYQRITAETNADVKLQLILDFETQYPHSKGLLNIYLKVIDLYRQKGDRVKVMEYGEKVLKLDGSNLTALLALSRTYALEKTNLDRAVELGQEAVTVIEKMKIQPTPDGYTETQWKQYLQITEESAKGILQYAIAIRGR